MTSTVDDPARLDDGHPTHPARLIERASYVIGCALVAAGLFHLLVFAVDGGPWYGPVSWRKPFTFGVSFGAVLIAVTWVSSYLRLAARPRTVLLGIFAVDCVLEVAGITVQAWRHVPSHFDTESPFDTVVAMNLAVGGGVLLVVLGFFARTALLGRVDGPATMRLALRGGFGLMVVGLLTGAAMIAHGEVLAHTGHLEEAYHDGGSVKSLHVVALLAIVVLPSVAWLAERTHWPEARRVRIVGRATAAYAALAVAALVLSLV